MSGTILLLRARNNTVVTLIEYDWNHTMVGRVYQAIPGMPDGASRLENFL